MKLSITESKRIKSKVNEFLSTNPFSKRHEIIRCLEILGEYDKMRKFKREIEEQLKSRISKTVKTSSFFDNYGVSVFIDIHND